jgi:hypothetical protein
MPDRIIKESCAKSDSLYRVSLLANMFWPFLLTAMDDHGCFDARPAILKARIFPLRKDVSEEMIKGWLGEFENANVGMIRLWNEQNGVQFGLCLSFEFHNDIVVKRSPTTPCPPWLLREGQDPRLGTETLQAFQRIEVAVAKLSSNGQEPTYRQIIGVAGCSASTLAKYRKHKAATACYTTLPGAIGTTPKNPNQNPNPKENQKGKEKKTIAPDSRRVPFKDFMFEELRAVGIEPVTDASDWTAYERLLAETRDKATSEPKAPFTLEKLKEYFSRFVHSPNRFDQDQGHPIRFFCTNVNKFMRNNGNGAHLGSSNGLAKAEAAGSTSERTTKTGQPKYIPRQ